MKTKDIFLFVVFGIIALLSSCKKDAICDCFESAGSHSSQTRSLPYFNQLSVYDDINVFLSIGPVEQVQIQGGENLIQNISADVSNNVLSLHNNNTCNWIRSYKKSIINVYITMPTLTYITSNGVGNIQNVDTITIDTFQIATNSSGNVQLAVHSKLIQCHLFGGGDLTLTGYSDEFFCNFFSGTGFAYCDKLSTGYTYCSSASMGDCYITTKGVLDAILYKNGNMYYAGNPALIHFKSYGNGKLIKE